MDYGIGWTSFPGQPEGLFQVYRVWAASELPIKTSEEHLRPGDTSQLETLVNFTNKSKPK
jgi:hypothetical protein